MSGPRRRLIRPPSVRAAFGKAVLAGGFVATIATIGQADAAGLARVGRAGATNVHLGRGRHGRVYGVRRYGVRGYSVGRYHPVARAAAAQAVFRHRHSTIAG